MIAGHIRLLGISSSNAAAAVGSVHISGPLALSMLISCNASLIPGQDGPEDETSQESRTVESALLQPVIIKRCFLKPNNLIACTVIYVMLFQGGSSKKLSLRSWYTVVQVLI